MFGAFSDCMINLNSSEQYYGSSECLVFTLEPEEEVYYCTGENLQNIHSEYGNLTFGSLSPAISLNEDLKGYSYPCKTYATTTNLINSPNNNFTCLKMEIYSLTI